MVGWFWSRGTTVPGNGSAVTDQFHPTSYLNEINTRIKTIVSSKSSLLKMFQWYIQLFYSSFHSKWHAFDLFVSESSQNNEINFGQLEREKQRINISKTSDWWLLTKPLHQLDNVVKQLRYTWNKTCTGSDSHS